MDSKASLDFSEIELNDCPVCRGDGIIEEEAGWCCYVSCMDCGAHTAEIPYKTEEEKASAAMKAAQLWNIGKVVKMEPGE